MILFSDFDNTLYFKDEPARTAQNVAAVKTWKSAGHQFCITTGRSYKSLANTAGPKFIDLSDYLILNCGSIIRDSSSKFLNTFSFDPKLINRIVELAESSSQPCKILYYTPSNEVFDRPSERIIKVNLWFHNDNQLGESLRTIQSLPVQAYQAHRTNDQLHPELQDYYSLIEIVPEKSGKSNAITTLTSLENIPSRDILTVGDSENDRQMIQKYSGYIIEDSKLAATGGNFKSTPSLADLIANFS